MTRRQAIQQSLLMTTGLILAADTVHGDAGGFLTVDLSQWKHIAFKLGNRTHIISVEDAFDALERS
jgi:hypothetical protein